jgi:hypothetical protein
MGRILLLSLVRPEQGERGVVSLPTRGCLYCMSDTDQGRDLIIDLDVDLDGLVSC